MTGYGGLVILALNFSHRISTHCSIKNPISVSCVSVLTTLETKQTFVMCTNPRSFGFSQKVNDIDTFRFALQKCIKLRQ